MAAASALDAEPTPWADSFVARIEALALIESLNADLLSHDSATLTLERWCADHRLADPALIVAERVHDADKPASAEVRAALDVKSDEPLGYRRVRLKCGDRVLSEADNWYVPARLTPEMNHVLESTDTPFGKAVSALRFRRRTLSADLLWRPLPKGWEMSAAPPQGEAGALAVPEHVLEHRAVLSMPDGEPFSEVVETYTGEVLAFPPPK
jgi:chorismate-pyruvate lyase